MSPVCHTWIICSLVWSLAGVLPVETIFVYPAGSVYVKVLVALLEVSRTITSPSTIVKPVVQVRVNAVELIDVVFTQLTLLITETCPVGVGVAVGVAVTVAVGVTVAIAVEVAVAGDVAVAVAVCVAVAVRVVVGVALGVPVGVGAGDPNAITRLFALTVPIPVAKSQPTPAANAG